MDASSAASLNTALTGRYDIEREIGVGGMATVYLAHDVRHDRKVALKVLRPELGAVLGVERFLAEIQVTAKLQHPNLLPLFDSGEANGLLFYVMPYVAGETLRARLDHAKQLPIDEALHIASSIAGALEYAHQHGVIHRDLKPENILLQSGQPVIADFGIALAVSNAGGARITQTGVSLGTPQYMSPEQATGDRAIDRGTDIYSLGAITFEMLVGDPPHLGGTAQAIIAKVLTERPPSVRAARPSVSEEMAWAVERALEKLPADRWSTAGDFADALRGKVAPRIARPRVAAPSVQLATSPRIRALLASTSLVALGGVVTSLYLATRPRAPAIEGEFEIRLPDSVTVATGAGTKIALSRDGTQLVVVGTNADGQRALYLRRLTDPTSKIVRGSDSASVPSFSPDGRWILYETVSGTLKKLPVTGGTPQTLADSVGTAASWGDDGNVVFGHDGGIWLTSSDRRDPKLIARPDPSRHIYRFLWPEMLPGGAQALVAIDRHPSGNVVDSLRLGVISLRDGEVVDLGIEGTNPHYAEPGRIVFGRAGGFVLSAPFSIARRKVTGPPDLAVENVWQASGGATGFAVSQSGILAFHSGDAATRQLVIVDRSGTARVLPGDPAPFGAPRISPDGRRAAIPIRNSSGVSFGISTTDVLWIVDLATGARERLTPDSTSIRGEWTTDGSRVVFLRTVGGAILSRSWNRSGGQVTLRAGSEGMVDFAIGASAGYWAFRRGTGSRADILVAPSDSLNAIRPFVATAASETMPRVSPSGRLLAYQSNETGRNEVYIQPLPGPGPRVAVSIGGGEEPIWARDGSTLFYRGPAWMMAAGIAERPQVVVTRRDSLFVDGYARGLGFSYYDAFANGRDFLMLTGTRSVRREVSVIVGWTGATARKAR